MAISYEDLLKRLIALASIIFGIFRLSNYDFVGIYNIVISLSILVMWSGWFDKNLLKRGKKETEFVYKFIIFMFFVVIFLYFLIFQDYQSIKRNIVI